MNIASCRVFFQCRIDHHAVVAFGLATCPIMPSAQPVSSIQKLASHSSTTCSNSTIKYAIFSSIFEILGLNRYWKNNLAYFIEIFATKSFPYPKYFFKKYLFLSIVGFLISTFLKQHINISIIKNFIHIDFWFGKGY